MTTQGKHEAESGSIVPCLCSTTRRREAAVFGPSTRTFPEGRITARSHYPSSGGNPSGKAPGSLLTAAFEIGGQRFTALNGGPMFKLNPSISFFVHVDAPDDANRLFATLAEVGFAMMPL